MKNQKVLDAGCGEGYLSRMLAAREAVVTAVDYSPRMLEIAKERTPDELHIHYRHGNCEDLHFLDEQSFDIIISNMVIQDLANDEKAFQEMHRLLKDGGCFIFSILHPCSSPRKADGREPKTGKSSIGTLIGIFTKAPMSSRWAARRKCFFFTER